MVFLANQFKTIIIQINNTDKVEILPILISNQPAKIFFHTRTLETTTKRKQLQG